VNVRARACACVWVCAYVCVCLRACVRDHARVRDHTRVGEHVRVRVHVRVHVRARVRVRGVLHESRRYLPLYGIYSFRVNFCSLPFTCTYIKKGLRPLLHEQAQWFVRYLHVQVPVPAVLPYCKKIFKSHWICMRHCTDMYLLSILNI
jgi:hypothetical protein